MRSLFLAAWLLELTLTAVSWFWLPERVSDPGRTLDRGAFVLLMLVLAFIAWIIQLHRRFALPPGARAEAPVSRQARRPERRPGA